MTSCGVVIDVVDNLCRTDNGHKRRCMWFLCDCVCVCLFICSLHRTKFKSPLGLISNKETLTQYTINRVAVHMYGSGVQCTPIILGENKVIYYWLNVLWEDPSKLFIRSFWPVWINQLSHACSYYKIWFQRACFIRTQSDTIIITIFFLF